MKEHLKKIKETIDVERGYSLGTVFTTRNKQYMYDTGTGKVFECGVNEYRILKVCLNRQVFLIRWMEFLKKNWRLHTEIFGRW